jgi:hypothetical protein
MTAKVNVLTRGKSFLSALYCVRRELKTHGCLTEKVVNLKVYQTPISFSYGYQYYQEHGDIVIPQVSLSRLWDNFFGGDYVSIRDIIRHEYAHGIAHCHPKMVDTVAFRKTFDGDHDSGESLVYDPESHVTAYAAKNSCEDFAEVFMYFLKYRGKIPPMFSGLPVIEKKWRFIETMCKKLKKLKQG